MAWANTGITELNAAAGFPGPVVGPSTAGQRMCLDHVRGCYRELGPPPAEAASSREALRVCLASSAVYQSDRSDVVP